MGMNFEFATAGRIIFGRGCLSRIGEIAAFYGQQAFLVTGQQALQSSGKLDILLKYLSEKGVRVSRFVFTGEPEINAVEKALASARAEKCDLVIGAGGGSVIDLAKAVSGLLTNKGSLLDYLEIVGKGRLLSQPAAPLIAVPTTSGTGAEVTANAVIKDPVNRQKVSLRSPFLLPRAAIIDPELTLSLSPELTAQSGLDALIHLMEAYTSRKAQPVSDLFCRDGICRAGRSLVKACENGADLDAREDMAMAGLEGGLVLANAGLGAVHGFAGVLGGAYSIPHGLACACLLPYVFEANIQKLSSQSPDHPVLQRYREVTGWMTGNNPESLNALQEKGKSYLLGLNRRLKMPSLSRFGIKPGELPELAAKAATASSMKANPVVFSQAELVDILLLALG